MSTAVKFHSPKGDLQWVTYEGEGKENMSGKLQYVANVVVAPEVAADLIATLEAFWEENKPAGFKKAPKSMGYYSEVEKNPETDEWDIETGRVSFAFKTGVEYSDGKPKVINIHNAKGNQISLGGRKIGNGSIGIIGGAMGVYENKQKGKVLDAGVTLYLNSIQITKFEEYKDGDTFEAQEEDGFEGFDDSTEQFADQSMQDNSAKPKL